MTKQEIDKLREQADLPPSDCTCGGAARDFKYAGTNLSCPIHGDGKDYNQQLSELKTPLPVEAEESQDVLWNDVYMHLVREWMETAYKGKVNNDFFAAIKSKYHITKINK